MYYKLYYLEEALGNAWVNEFTDAENVEIIDGDICRTDCDAIVSPANSFGFMDGGLDYVLSEHFGWDLEADLQAEIKQLPEGELLVGKALVVATGDEKVPWLISAPTMRVPMNFNIHTSINAYLAMKAILIAAKAHPEIESVAIPGLCTGVGKMPFHTASRQMFRAYEEIELGKKPHFPEFGDAQKYHWRLNEDGMIWY